ncbi:MAG: DsrE family protein [Bacteroidales bacterium]|nr:DsrE family protein [Bacteroidales bacterium]
MSNIQKYHVVFHLEEDNNQSLNIATNNLGNLLLHDHNNVVAVFVANFRAPTLFLRSNNFDFKYIEEWIRMGKLKILICRNSLQKLNISEKDLFPFCTVIPSGIVKIIELQNEGYAYIRP